jgi:hypothetical protein
MLTFRELEKRIIADGRVDARDLEFLRERICRDDKVDRQEADFLVVLYDRSRSSSPAFRRYFYQAIKEHLLADGKICAAETACLEQILFYNDRLEDEEWTLLRERQCLELLQGGQQLPRDPP